MRVFLTGMLMLFGIFGMSTVNSAPLQGTFQSIDGETLDLESFRGQPVLVVNTASMCGFTGQYDGLQTLYDTYRERGLIVLAVPSNDFNQEFSNAEEVKEFCETRFDLTLPMADITQVTGPDAHPFFREVAQQTGFVPRWNFNKILLSPDGNVVKTWGSLTRPMSGAIRQAVEGQLNS